jgi:hypothetical protein
MFDGPHLIYVLCLISCINPSGNSYFSQLYLFTFEWKWLLIYTYLFTIKEIAVPNLNPNQPMYHHKPQILSIVNLYTFIFYLFIYLWQAITTNCKYWLLLQVTTIPAHKTNPINQTTWTKYFTKIPFKKR